MDNQIIIEEFRPIKGYENTHDVSNIGRVRNSKGRILKQQITHKGYCDISLFSNKNRKHFAIHRLVYSTFHPDIDISSYQIDHIDRNKQNNCLTNLRLASNSENQRNQPKCGNPKLSKYVGVSKQRNKWYAYISIGGKKKHLGTFDTEVEAARVYQSKAKEIHGEFYCEQKIED